MNFRPKDHDANTLEVRTRAKPAVLKHTMPYPRKPQIFMISIRWRRN
jgi:hypothetical protein